MVGFLENEFSTWLLYGNVVLFAVFLVFYLAREPFWRSWIGLTIVLLTVAILQLSVRAVLTVRYGEDYPGRDLVLMLGRFELFVSGVVVFLGLLRLRRRSS